MIDAKLRVDELYGVSRRTTQIPTRHSFNCKRGASRQGKTAHALPFEQGPHAPRPLRLPPDEEFHPAQIDFFRAQAVVKIANALANLVQKTD